MEKTDKILDFDFLKIKDSYSELLQKSGDYIQFIKKAYCELETNYNGILESISEKSKCQNELEHLKMVVSPYLEKISKTENRIGEYESEIGKEVEILETKLVKYASILSGSEKKGMPEVQHKKPEEKSNNINEFNVIKNEIENLRIKLLEQNKDLKEIYDFLDTVSGEIVNLKNKISNSIELMEKSKSKQSNSDNPLHKADELKVGEGKQTFTPKDQKNDFVA